MGVLSANGVHVGGSRADGGLHMVYVWVVVIMVSPVAMCVGHDKLVML